MLPLVVVIVGGGGRRECGERQDAPEGGGGGSRRTDCTECRRGQRRARDAERHRRQCAVTGSGQRRERLYRSLSLTERRHSRRGVDHAHRRHACGLAAVLVGHLPAECVRSGDGVLARRVFIPVADLLPGAIITGVKGVDEASRTVGSGGLEGDIQISGSLVCGTDLERDRFPLRESDDAVRGQRRGCGGRTWGDVPDREGLACPDRHAPLAVVDHHGHGVVAVVVGRERECARVRGRDGNGHAISGHAPGVGEHVAPGIGCRRSERDG